MESISSTQQHTQTFLQGIDYVELYVSNVKQSVYYFQHGYGFTPIAYAGMETGLRDRVSFVLRQGNCYLVLTAPLTSEGDIADHISIHGDSIKDIAFHVTNVHEAFLSAIKGGAHPVQEPITIQDEDGYLIKATIATFGDTVHSFVQRVGLRKQFLPGYQLLPDVAPSQHFFEEIDHCAISIPYGELDQWVKFYTEIFHFHLLHEEGIVTEYSAMNSKALQDPTEHINFVLVEPLPGKRTSQVEEFLNFHQGAGVQHLALHTPDIVQTVRTLQTRDIHFVTTPSSYYDMLIERVGRISEDVEALRATDVLVDRDEWGYLLQIFAKPLHQRPTLFIEVIQRKQARGFGSGNIQALFKALEREQAKRGNL